MSSAPTDQRRIRIASIDSMRALALLAVFAFHSWEFAGHPYIPVVSYLVSQNVRPDFFVVLTGFVLFLPFARDMDRLTRFRARPYFTRRLRRIVPPYWAALLYAMLLPQVLVLLFRAAGQEASWQPWPSLGDLVAHLTFTQMFFPEYWAGINGSLWTMSLEMQLYVLFPLVVFAVHRWGVWALGWAMGVSIAFNVLVAAFGPQGFPEAFLWTANGLGRLVEFAAGIAAALIVFRSRRRLTPLAAITLLAAIAVSYAIAVNPALNATLIPFRTIGLSVFFGGLIVLVLRLPALDRALAWKPLSWVGYRSYSLFLIHQPTIWYVSEFAQKVLDVSPGPALLAVLWTIGLGVVVGIGQIFFLVIEKPCIAWAKRTPVDVGINPGRDRG